MIDPDQFKVEQGETDHENSIEKAIFDLEKKLKDPKVMSIIYQGTGSWYPYMLELVGRVQKIDSNTKMMFLFATASLDTCRKRCSKDSKLQAKVFLNRK